jgi:MFS family permease
MVLWFGQVMSQVADKVFFVLLISLLDSYHSPRMFENSMRSALMVAFTLPAILFGSAAGIFVDRLPKKPMMIAADADSCSTDALNPLIAKAVYHPVGDYVFNL